MKKLRTVSSGVTALAAMTLLLGYLHVMVMYSHRLDAPSMMHANSQSDSRHEFKSKRTNFIRPHQQERLNAKDARQQMEEAQQTVPPLVQTTHYGMPIANSTASSSSSSSSTMGSSRLLVVGNAQVRSKRVLYIITPTHVRMTQMVDMIRFQQTLQLAAAVYRVPIYWIIIEDATACSKKVRMIAEESGLPFAHKAITYQRKETRRALKTQRKRKKKRQRLRRPQALWSKCQIGTRLPVNMRLQGNIWHESKSKSRYPPTQTTDKHRLNTWHR